jgi:predicted negative regulator of RcsB-dependent stress response
MSAKDVIDAEVKELKEDEGLMLKVFKLEKFFNKNKKKIISLFVILFLILVAYKINNYITEQNLIKTNNAYVKLLENPNDKESLAILKDNKPLYELYIFNTAKNDIKILETLKSASNEEISSIANYKLAMLKGDIKSVENYTLSTNSLLKNAALYTLQRLYLEKGDINKAKEVADKISKDSVYKDYSKALLHYGVAK